MTNKYDVIIIGGGVVGCMVARYLSKYKLDVLLIEKESDVGMGTSSANSAIMHAGYDALPGTLKAKTNSIAAPLWDDLSQELSIPFSRCGDYVVAVNQEEVETLEKLRQQGIQNGVPELKIITGEELRIH